MSVLHEKQRRDERGVHIERDLQAIPNRKEQGQEGEKKGVGGVVPRAPHDPRKTLGRAGSGAAEAAATWKQRRCEEEAGM